MSDKQQSATDYFSEKVFDLFNQLNNEEISLTEFRIEMRKIEFDSEELFKQQIIDARLDACIEYSGTETAIITDIETSEQYYNDKFKT